MKEAEIQYKEYMEKRKAYIYNMTLDQAIEEVSERYAHRDMDNASEKAIYMLLECAKRKTGKWLNVENGIEYDWATCSKCGGRTMMARRYYPFCPNCGAEMGGE